jgi:hypothetical protein
VEQQIIAVCDVEALIGSQEKLGARRDSVRETECKSSGHSTQCFMCSRIYFDQHLSKCPNCNNVSLQHYTTADLNHFAQNGVRGPF